MQNYEQIDIAQQLLTDTAKSVFKTNVIKMRTIQFIEEQLPQDLYMNYSSGLYRINTDNQSSVFIPSQYVYDPANLNQILLQNEFEKPFTTNLCGEDKVNTILYTFYNTAFFRKLMNSSAYQYYKRNDQVFNHLLKQFIDIQKQQHNTTQFRKILQMFPDVVEPCDYLNKMLAYMRSEEIEQYTQILNQNDRNTTSIDQIFGNFLTKTICCVECGFRCQETESLLMIQLIPNRTLKRAIREFLKTVEIFQICRNCNKQCTQKVEKQLNLSSKILLFSFPGNKSFTKVNTVLEKRKITYEDSLKIDEAEYFTYQNGIGDYQIRALSGLKGIYLTSNNINFQLKSHGQVQNVLRKQVIDGECCQLVVYEQTQAVRNVFQQISQTKQIEFGTRERDTNPILIQQVKQDNVTDYFEPVQQHQKVQELEFKLDDPEQLKPLSTDLQIEMQKGGRLSLVSPLLNTNMQEDDIEIDRARKRKTQKMRDENRELRQQEIQERLQQKKHDWKVRQQNIKKDQRSIERRKQKRF